MTITETRQCARPGCTNYVEIIPGHRPRRYCGNACKQLAYLQREDEKRLQAEAAAQQEQYERDVEVLRQRYGLNTLPPKVLDELLRLRSHYSVGLMHQVGEMLVLAVRDARQSYNETANALREEIMIVGEQLNFVAITGPQNQTVRGVQQYCDAIGQQASLEELYAMRDSVHLAKRARQRLTEVSALLEAKYSNRHSASS